MNIILSIIIKWFKNELKVIKYIILIVQYLSYLDLAIKYILYKALDALAVEFSALWLVFGHVLSEGNEAHRGALISFQSKELKDPLVVVIIDVDVDEQNLNMKRRNTVNVY